MIKKGDKVIVIAGKDRKKTGEVTRVFPKTGKVLIAGVNVMKRHRRPTRSGAKGAIVDMEHPISISNVKLQK